MTTTDNRSAVRWFALAIIFALLVCAAGCGSRTEAAKATKMSMHGTEAAMRINAQAQVTFEDRQAINQLLAGALELQSPVLAGLELGEPVDVSTTVESAMADPVAFRQAAQVQAHAAWKEAEHLTWLARLGRTVFGWLGVASQSLLGITLGAAGGAGLVGGIAAKLIQWRGRIRKVLQAATSFGDHADALLKDPQVPEPVRATWSQVKTGMAKAQDALGVRPEIEKARAAAPKPSVLVPPTIAPEPQS